MAREKLTRTESLTALAERPERIAELTAGLTRAQLRARTGDNEWAAVELLAHLRCCSDAWGEAISTILAEDHPTIVAVNPRALLRDCDYARRPFAASLAAYSDQRAGLLAVLRGLDARQWRRAATIRGAGAPLERTVHDYASRLAVHERGHDRQFARMARQLRG
jgi:hypothetical protein